MKHVRFFLLFTLLLIPLTIFAVEVKEYKLENGIKVLIIEEHKAPVATFQIWYRTGSIDEPAGKSGLSHLLEHMMFKGTPEYGPRAFSRIVQKNGGTDNAYTTKDYTVYFQILSSDRIGISIDLEADRMQNLTLDPKETLSERSVVMEERRQRYDDDPESSLFEEVVAIAFKIHPYRRPVIGWMSDIRAMEREDLYHYYKTYYSPDNAVIVIVGDVDSGELIKKIRLSFDEIPSGPPKVRIASIEPEQIGERRLFLKKEAKLPHMIAAFHTPSFPHEDSYALEVLSLIFSDGKSSRLYSSLVYKKKLALEASAYYSGFNKDPYLFFFFVTASPGRDIKDVEDALYTEIERIKKDPPSQEEVQKAKNQLESAFIMDQDSIFMQAMKYGTFEMLGDWRFIDRYLEGIRRVTPEDVVRVAKKYLKEENRTVGILIPTKTVRVNSEQ
ncbi:MAG: pitrilysin family protein [Thermodesulfovibrionales bacterium]|nr:pitrilysin family protein [Thermodesulfovibrionales bacterium]